jgi:hypothetical protein
MRLIHRSHRAANAVRTVSPSGELFVASIVICMILASFGDAVDPTWLGEAGLEFAFFDFGGEFSVLAMRHWHLLELLLAGGVMSCASWSARSSLPSTPSIRTPSRKCR